MTTPTQKEGGGSPQGGADGRREPVGTSERAERARGSRVGGSPWEGERRECGMGEVIASASEPTRNRQTSPSDDPDPTRERSPDKGRSDVGEGEEGGLRERSDRREEGERRECGSP